METIKLEEREHKVAYRNHESAELSKLIIQLINFTLKATPPHARQSKFLQNY